MRNETHNTFFENSREKLFVPLSFRASVPASKHIQIYRSSFLGPLQMLWQIIFLHSRGICTMSADIYEYEMIRAPIPINTHTQTHTQTHTRIHLRLTLTMTRTQNKNACTR